MNILTKLQGINYFKTVVNIRSHNRPGLLH